MPLPVLICRPMSRTDIRLVVDNEAPAPKAPEDLTFEERDALLATPGYCDPYHVLLPSQFMDYSWLDSSTFAEVDARLGYPPEDRAKWAAHMLMAWSPHNKHTKAPD